jgi:2-polyprenyl-3-methyl-5-hydroxy-6-metoxy-1,4-benzoquinol methylase
METNLIKKYYEYYEDVYAAAFAAGVDRCNNPPGKDFATLFERSLLPPRGQVLDLGCGEGLYALLFAAEGYQVTGVDISLTALTWARQRAAEQGISNVHFIVGDVTALTGLAKAGFDLVCLRVNKNISTHLHTFTSCSTFVL